MYAILSVMMFIAACISHNVEMLLTSGLFAIAASIVFHGQNK